MIFPMTAAYVGKLGICNLELLSSLFGSDLDLGINVAIGTLFFDDMVQS